MNSCLQLQQNLLSFPITTNLHNKKSFYSVFCDTIVGQMASFGRLW